MDIYQVVGGFAVVLFCCIGIASIGCLALYGGYRLLERHDAVKGLLENRPGIYERVLSAEEIERMASR